MLETIIGALAAFGALSAVWVGFGWLLLRGRPGRAAYFCMDGEDPEPVLRELGWLRGLGLFRGKLWIVDGALSAQERARLVRRYHNTEFCSSEELPERLKQERNGFGWR